VYFLTVSFSRLFGRQGMCMVWFEQLKNKNPQMVKSFKLLEILTWVHKREGRHTSRNISRAKDLFVFLTKKKKKNLQCLLLSYGKEMSQRFDFFSHMIFSSCHDGGLACHNTMTRVSSLIIWHLADFLEAMSRRALNRFCTWQDKDFSVAMRYISVVMGFEWK